MKIEKLWVDGNGNIHVEQVFSSAELMKLLGCSPSEYLEELRGDLEKRWKRSSEL